VCPRFSVLMLSCVGGGLATGRSPIQGFIVSEFISDLEQATGPNPRELQ